MNLDLMNVSVDLGGREVVHDVSCSLASGGWLAVLGPNGAGKSTLLRAIAGLTEYRGTVAIDGRDTTTMRRRELAMRIAVVAQKPTVPEGATVLDYAALGRTPHIRYFGIDRPARSRRGGRRARGARSVRCGTSPGAFTVRR